jgi:hypothetical protein
VVEKLPKKHKDDAMSFLFAVGCIANSTEKGLANCEFEHLDMKNGQTMIGLQTKRNISAGEQLLVVYKMIEDR